ncbi:MAG: 3-deoxy-manno-octulosonate cytidylyltransferase [Candidatus Omnitrophica bacterium]|nr:3-deoxy-manno-octulosonate cytidylyltransferase [Candidatus Omnitrophota bacterium]
MSRQEAVCIIPARLESTRFPRKLLQVIEGKPLLQFAYESAKRAKRLGHIVVACDHELIKDSVQSFGGEAILTAPHHTSGTERIAEVASGFACEFIVNLQGDEPLMHSSVIDQIVEVLQSDSSCVMSTACVLKNDPEEFLNPNVVKVTRDQNGWALYFSRSPIPYDRDQRAHPYFKHLGIYGYRREFLLQFPKLPPSTLEQREKLEQLRALENGYRIKVVETVHDSIGVDTEEDFQIVRKRLASDRIGARSA